MPKSGDRFYLLEFRNRPVLHGDIGSLLKIDGLVVSGGGAQAILLLPSTSLSYEENYEAGTTELSKTSVFSLSLEEWNDFIHRSDDPEILSGEPKVFQRKARHEISGTVQQKIWVADKFECKYCSKKMGEVQLTIDHFMPIELGGANNTTNYLSACRRCNKDKGSEDPKDFCNRRKIGYADLVSYLLVREVK